MADVDAALMQQILDVAQRERETDIHHDRQADDFGGRLEVPKRGAFCHPGKLDRRPARFNQLSSDNTPLSVANCYHLDLDQSV